MGITAGVTGERGKGIMTMESKRVDIDGPLPDNYRRYKESYERYMSGETQKEIAESLGVSNQRIQQYIQRWQRELHFKAWHERKRIEVVS